MSESEMGWLGRITARILAGEANAVITEALQTLTTDPNSVNTLISLASAYNYQGQGSQSEPYARLAFDIVNRRTAANWQLVYIVHLALFDALVAQGHFLQAARLLQPRIEGSRRTNMMCGLTAWGYYLAHENELARQALERTVSYQPDEKESGDERFAGTSKLSLVVGYIRREVNRDEVVRGAGESIMFLASQRLADWENEARRNAHNPYGQRLAEILKEMRAQIPGSAFQLFRNWLRFAGTGRGGRR